MQFCISVEDFSSIENNNIIGIPEKMNKSRIEFYGENNIIFFDEGVKLNDSTIRFLADNSVVFIGSSGNHKTKLKVDIYNYSAFYIGSNCNTTRPIHVVLSEGKNVIIGDDCLFSLDIWFRNADPHLIYDGATKKRINMSRSVFVGDHVWIGQDAFVSKGSCIGSGSIVGAKSVTGGKTIPSNCSTAGVPCKIIRENIFWLKPSVHKYLEEDTEKSMNYDKDTYMYSADGKQIEFNMLEQCLEDCKTSSEMFDVLKEKIFENKDKNRFFIPPKNANRSGLRKLFSK